MREIFRGKQTKGVWEFIWSLIISVMKTEKTGIQNEERKKKRQAGLKASAKI